MRRFALPLGLAGLVLAAPAAAQIQPDVTANPNATGTKVLLYPGGQYGRVQKDLLQPGEPYPGGRIVLHMPRKHALNRAAKVAKPKPRIAVAAAPPSPPPQPVATLNDLPKESAARLLMEQAQAPPPSKPRPAPPKQVATAKPPPPKPAPAKPAPAKPAPPQDDSLSLLSGNQVQQPEPRVASIDTSDATKRSSIMFAPGAEEPPVSALDTIKNMTPSLTAALWSGTAHIQIEAFGGKQGDKSSDARRLSLKRALIIRQLLIDDGIPSERVVVRAMGGAPSGALDRVDIFVAA